MTTGTPLDGEAETNTLGRFDLALIARLDAAYQLADQRYRNRAKAWSSGVAVLMAVFGGWIVSAEPSAYLPGQAACTLMPPPCPHPGSKVLCPQSQLTGSQGGLPA